jgi:hypothetical protein
MGFERRKGLLLFDPKASKTLRRTRAAAIQKIHHTSPLSILKNMSPYTDSR